MKKIFAGWTYIPKDYFKGEIIVEDSDYSLKINDGKIEFVVQDGGVSETHSKCSDLVESFFIIELLKNRVIYELKVSSLKLENEDCSFSVYLKTRPIAFTYSFGTKVTFFTIMDKNGNVIEDSEEEMKTNQIELL